MKRNRQAVPQSTADTQTASQPHANANATLERADARLVHAKTQRARILRTLIDARGAWVPLPEILALGIAQYGSRILELRRLGFSIENKTERIAGVRRSWFRLANSPVTTEREEWQDRGATGLPLFDLGMH